ncbi:hypothetical protein OEIGOIKO_03427 [Streptomyces chrestomyceticus JCM 4735]|uniref:Uncharacterized protein n=1 Tax=Streptomyces chrestomyceticus JCM 4735 TaxID=1306181 RepID=A0A7U9KUS4_9ACTN|nr:hypothetical protein [Streptomyces chrestomyceticus]GCD35681.1 hypothetical protein OEIGOIKO_03427 [Streptomyces chrestomyceticus JCM 4735]
MTGKHRRGRGALLVWLRRISRGLVKVLKAVGPLIGLLISIFRDSPND